MIKSLIGMSSENKKNAHLKRHLGALFIRLNELGRVSNLPPKKFENFLIKFQLTKSDPKRARGWKVPCLMPIRVKDREISECIFNLASSS